MSSGRREVDPAGMTGKATVTLLVGLLAVGILGYAYFSVWYSPSIRGQVVDASTNKPLAGAVLVATWEVSSWESYPVKQLAVREATTDADGRFTIRAWGPRFHLGVGSMRGNEPFVRVWAHGYVPLILNNTPDHVVPQAFAYPIILSRLDGEVLRLEPALLTDRAYANALELLAIYMEFAYRGLNCEWREVPRMLVLLQTTGRELAGTEIAQRVLLRPVEHVVVRDQCGDPRDFFEEYLPAQ